MKLSIIQQGEVAKALKEHLNLSDYYIPTKVSFIVCGDEVDEDEAIKMIKNAGGSKFAVVIVEMQEQ